MRAAAGLALSLPCAVCACAEGSAYSGTGSLGLSGARTEPLLAHHVAALTECPLLQRQDGTVDEFSILALGDECVMDGVGGTSGFLPDPGTVCTLAFADGAHPLRVTDVAVRYGVTAYVQVELGGDDAKTGLHALYRFTGSALEEAPAMGTCDGERAKHVARRPEAFRRGAPDPREDR
jgi:hypothetical protein